MASLREVTEAGVILRDPRAHPPRYLVIQRAADWSLPKGHWCDGETPQQTAVRELLEETACRAELEGPAGTHVYQTGDERRTVHFFHATYAGTEPTRTLDGVLQARWLPREQAAEQLTHDDLKDFFRAVTTDAGGAEAVAAVKTVVVRAPHDVRADRLATTIDLFRTELPGIRGGSPVVDDTVRWATIDGLVALAERYAQAGRIDASWEALHAAQRLTLHDLDQAAVRGRAAARRAEAASKLTGWRLDAAQQLLAGEDVSAASLVEATRLLDEQSNNVYLKLRLTRVAVPLAAGLLTLILAMLVVAVSFGWFVGLSDTAEPFVLTDLGLLGGSMVLGAFGAVLSLTLDRATGRQASQRIWQLIDVQRWVPVARVAIGAASGVVVVAATQSSLAEGGQAWAVLTAIPAGFSERLVRRSVESLDVSGGEARPPRG